MVILRNVLELREYKRKMKGICLADGKSVSRKGRLTDVMINRNKNYFGQCIRNNKGNLQGMQNDIWAILKHMIQDDSISTAEKHAMDGASAGQIIQTTILPESCHLYLLMLLNLYLQG